MAKKRKKTSSDSNKPREKENGKAESSQNPPNPQEQIEEIFRKREQAFLEEEQVLYSWRAPSRIFKKKSKEFFTTVGAIVILISIILLFVQQFMLMAVIIAFSFVAYMYATVEPEPVEHVLTTRGIRSGGRFYRWDVLGRFWIEKESDKTILYIETLLRFPNQLILVIPEKSEEEIFSLLQPYVFNEKPEPGFLDKATEWLQEKFPIEGAG